MSEGGDDNRLLARIPGTLAFKKRQTIWYAMLICCLLGTLASSVPSDELGNCLVFVEVILFAYFALRWCFLDAEERGRRVGRWLVLTICLITTLGVPIYLIRTRGLQRGIVACIVFVCLFCLLLGSEWFFSSCLNVIRDWKQGE